MTSLPLSDPTRLLDDLDFVRSLARQLCHNQHAAEDVAQATMTSAIQAPPKKVDNWRGWLATVARNLAKKHYRSESRRASRERHVAKLGAAPSTAEVVAREELRTSVVQTVLALPESYRKIVLLRHFHGLSIAECATSLDIPQSTARTQLSRAMERLRQQLDAQHQGDRKAWVSGLLPFAMPTASTAPMVATATVGANKKALVAVLAAALAIGWFTWSGEQVVTPPAHDQKLEQAHAATSPDERSDNQRNRNVAAQTSNRREAQPTATIDPWTATGTVLRSEDEKGLHGATVLAWATVGERHHSGKQIPIGRAVTDSDGTFALGIETLRSLSPIVQAQMFVYAHVDAVGYEAEILETSLGDILSGNDNGKLDTELTAEILTKGRVVTVDGAPVDEARLLLFSGDGYKEYNTEFDGTFAIYLDHDQEPVTYSLVAVHGRFGRSDAVLVHSHQPREQQLGELVLQPVGQRIEGFVHYPDGQPVADQTISVQLENDSELPGVIMHGREIAGFTDALQSDRETTTDRLGRFVFHNARPGTYEIDLDGDLTQQLIVRPGQQVTRIDIEYTMSHRPAQIEVVLEDEHGTWLPEAFYGVHVWHGAEALVAQARFAREGASNELMATASEDDAMFAGSDRFLEARPDTFTVVESCFHNSGPNYGSCLLGPNQHRGIVRIALGPRIDTGSLNIDVRDAHGKPIQPLWIRMRRVSTRSGLALCLPGRETSYVPPSEIPGRWHAVPKSARLHDLPVGTFTVEVLAGPEVRNGKVQRCPNPVIRNTVTVTKNGTATFRERTSAGVPLTVEIQLPAIAEGERLHNAHAQVALVPITGGRIRHLNLQPTDGSRKVLFRNGRAIARSRGMFKPGTYELHYSPNLSLQRQQPAPSAGKSKWLLTNTRWRKVKRVVELRADMEPIVIKIERK